MCALAFSGGFLAGFQKWKSARRPCHFGKYLLTVGGDEQQETAISPSILNTFVVRFLECIAYMYMHSSMMLECKKCDFIPSECKMSCSLLTTVTATNGNISINTGYLCGAFFAMSSLSI